MKRHQIIISAFLFISTLNAAALGNHEPKYVNWDYATHNQVGLYSMRVAAKDDIELSRDDSSIVSMSSGAILYIREKRSGKTTELLADVSGGKPSYSLWINGLKRNISAWETSTVAEILVKVANDFGIGGKAKMDRLFREDGIREAMAVISRIQSSSAIAYLLITFVESHSLNVRDSIAVVEETRNIKSGSTLAQVLTFCARKLPDDDAITAALMNAVGGIASSSDTRDTLIDIADERGLTSESVLEMVKVTKRIASGSDKSEVLIFLSDILSRAKEIDESVFREYLSATNTIASSGDKQDALIALIRTGIPSQSYSDFFRVTTTIASSSNKTNVLIESAVQMELSAGGARHYLDAAITIASSSDKLRALNALNGKQIDDGDFRYFFRVVNTIASSSDKKDALIDVIRSQELSIESLGYYLDSAKTFASSSDKKDAVLEMLAFIKKKGNSYKRDADLKDQVLSVINTIASTDDKEECLTAVAKTFE